MTSLTKKLEKQSEQLLEELRQIGEFRRGTINTVYRKCGKKRCVCNREGHPGHGPMYTLTFHEMGKTKTRSLPSRAAVELVREQVDNHDRFIQRAKEWQKLNEQACDLKLEEVLSGQEGEQDDLKKKLRRRSSRRSAGK